LEERQKMHFDSVIEQAKKQPVSVIYKNIHVYGPTRLHRRLIHPSRNNTLLCAPLNITQLVV
jgi:hypothetical protein